MNVEEEIRSLERIANFHKSPASVSNKLVFTFYAECEEDPGHNRFLLETNNFHLALNYPFRCRRVQISHGILSSSDDFITLLCLTDEEVCRLCESKIYTPGGQAVKFMGNGQPTFYRLIHESHRHWSQIQDALHGRLTKHLREIPPDLGNEISTLGNCFALP